MKDSQAIDAVVQILDEYLADAPVHVSIAWRSARGALRRARRVSSTTLPVLAATAQRAIIVRDSLQELLPLVHPALYSKVKSALELTSALVSTFGTNSKSSEPPISDD